MGLGEVRFRWTAVILSVLAIIPAVVTLPGLVLGAEVPEGMSIPAPESHDPMADKIVLIILDGLPAYVMEDPDFMPGLAAWSEHGAVMEVETSDITLTGPCTKELSTGRHASPMDAMRNWEVTYDGDDDPLHYAEEAGIDVGFTGFYVWSNLFPGPQFEHRTVYDKGFSDVYDADNETLGVLNEWIVDDGPDVMFAHLGGTDHAGHIFGIESDDYRDKMNILDIQLEQIRNSIPENWSLMITADHGMTITGGHAISTGQDAMRVLMLGTGSAFEPETSAEMTQRDISALLTVILDVPFAVSADARIPLDVLALDSEMKATLEAWNWEAAVSRQQWFAENGMSGATDISTDEIEWDALSTTTQSADGWDLAAAALTLLAIIILICRYSDIELVRDRGAFNAISIYSAIWLVNHYIFIMAEQRIVLGIDLFLIRKGIGIVLTAIAALLVLTSAFRDSRERIDKIDRCLDWMEDKTTAWFPVGLLAVTIWQPGSRLSPALFSLFLAMLTLRHSKIHENRTAVWGFWGLLVFSLWSVWNHSVHLFTGSSIQRLTGFDLFYKFQQRLVEMFMTENTILAILLICTTIHLCSRISSTDTQKSWWIDSAILSAVTLVHAYGDSTTDRLLLLLIAATAIAGLIEHVRGVVILREAFTLTLAELAIMMLIIPTWGAWPACCVLFLTRLVKTLFDGDGILPRGHDINSGWSGSSRWAANALIPFLLICLVWISFGQLSMIGLIEFNPSKWVVKGGFFGARVDPPIPWMVFITIAPTVAAISLVTNAWRATGRSISGLLVLLSFMLVTNMSHLWLSFSHPEVLLMIGFSSVVMILWMLATAPLGVLSRSPDRLSEPLTTDQ